MNCNDTDSGDKLPSLRTQPSSIVNREGAAFFAMSHTALLTRFIALLPDCRDVSLAEGQLTGVKLAREALWDRVSFVYSDVNGTKETDEALSLC